MTDFKLRGRCGGCGKIKLFIRKRKVKLPIGQVATSQKLFCNLCAKPLEAIK